MEKYRNILISVFLVLTFIIPTVIAIRAFVTAFSGGSSKSPGEKPETAAADVEHPEQEQNPH